MARYCIGEAARTRPDHVALIVVHDADAPAASAERWTYAELDDAVRAVAAGLLADGVAPGDRVLLRMGNTSDYALLFFGALTAGIVPLPSSAMLTAGEASFLLTDSAAGTIAVADGLVVELPPAAPPRLVEPEDLMRWRASPQRVEYADTAADDPAFLVYTSGTTGSPKGVLHAHRSAWGRRPMYHGWYGLRADDVMLHAGAFNWTYTLGVGLTDPWANGATALIYNGPKDPGVWPRLIEAHRATLFAAVPGVFRQLLHDGAWRAHNLSSLRHALTAGEALRPALREEWLAATGTQLYEALGMSECSTYISCSPTIPVRPGSPGRPQPGRCVQIIPAEPEDGDDPLPPGEVGLLAVHRSDPGLMLGYWNRPQEEQEVYRGEWFVGGDLAEFDDDGYVIYHGRNDDVMNPMGYRVSPMEVEAVLAAHPDVAEVAVTELVVKEGVAVVAAFVVPAVGAGRDPQALMAYAAQHLARYKCPREVRYLAGLPRTPNGKVLRRALPAQPVDQGLDRPGGPPAT
ncbi:MAG: acyl-CoA synthetase [Austwickia sp.]|nr:acyl-CoA synthetase [Austwickia sp.]MBK8437489.1 acyl-CoA synthetase [Austwickia sp.]MBK9102755.1 acyl-CoA synthetase [Austwickia sp.]